LGRIIADIERSGAAVGDKIPREIIIGAEDLLGFVIETEIVAHLTPRTDLRGKILQVAA